MIRLGAFDVAGHVVRIQASAGLAGLLTEALSDLSCASRRRAPMLTVESFADGTWSVSWPDEQRYDGPDEEVAFYDVFCALNDAASRFVATSGRVGLHGGAVRVGAGGVAVVGHSGAGKSTLTAGLVRAGHGFIADELTAVTLSSDSVEATATPTAMPTLHPYHRPIGLRTGGAEALGIDIPDGPFQYTYPLRAPEIGTLAGVTPLGLVVFVERDAHAEPGVEAISPASALHRLANHTLGTWDLEAETFARLDRLVRHTPAVAVRFGTSDEGVAMIEHAVQVHASL